MSYTYSSFHIIFTCMQIELLNFLLVLHPFLWPLTEIGRINGYVISRVTLNSHPASFYSISSQHFLASTLVSQKSVFYKHFSKRSFISDIVCLHLCMALIRTSNVFLESPTVLSFLATNKAWTKTRRE